MEYERSNSTSMTPIEKKEVHLIWANDGWCYIPQLKIRQKFTDTHYFHEEWLGVIAPPQHIETITWSLYSKEPRVWQEQGPQHSEVYCIKQKSRRPNFSVLPKQTRPKASVRKQPFHRP